MSTLLSNSIRLKKFHMIIVILLMMIIIWSMLLYFRMVEASIEEFAFRSNVELLNRILIIRNALAPQNENNCAKLNNPEFLSKLGDFMGTTVLTSSSGESSKASKWVYDVKKHTLLYFVYSQRYFRSPQGQQIQVHFYCEDNKISWVCGLLH